MSKRTIMAAAAGLVAGATLVGVPTFAYAAGDSGDGTPGSDMATVMDDPTFVDRMKQAMSEMMSDPELKEQMRSMMDGMGGMSGGGMGGMGGSNGQNNAGTP